MKKMFSLAPVAFRASAIEGRGVFARRRFDAGELVTPYAPKQERIDASDPRATEASKRRLTLLSEGRFIIIPDTSVHGGWLCNHSCNPNAVIFSNGAARIEAIRTIAPGDEVTVFYGWVTANGAESIRCRCGAASCRGFINFDVTDDDAARIDIRDDTLVTTDAALRARLEEYGAFLRSIGQSHVQGTIATTLARLKPTLG